MKRENASESVNKWFRLVCARLTIGLARSGKFDQPEEERAASGDMSVIVPILDCPKFLIRCLRSLEMYAPRAEIILIDDGSVMRETVDILEGFHHRKNWTLIRNERSLGHSRACEAGARLAMRPYLCFLNSDTVVTPWSWSAARKAFEADPKIAVTGPSTSWAITKQLVTKAKRYRFYWNDCQIFSFAQKYVKAHQHSELIDLPEISGFAFFIRRNVWESFGGFDENLPDYGNESELCIRLLKSGLRLVWTQNSYIHHFGNISYTTNKKAKSFSARAYIKEKHGFRHYT
jgi:N-acetylglucosaminyl-diphospho-decaprenol L-rhamnosyltransferase